MQDLLNIKIKFMRTNIIYLNFRFFLTSLLCLIVLLCANSKASSQGCLPGFTEFTTQSQIDSFPINNPGCTMVLGGIFIHGSDITNLLGFSSVSSIGHIQIYDNDSLTSLLGLNSLDTVMGQFLICDNPVLQTLAGLDSLKYVGNDLIIQSDSLLSSLEHLASLIEVGGDHIGGNLDVQGNYSLQNLQGLNSLQQVNGRIIIGANSSLENLFGISSLTGGDFYVHRNYSLIDFTGFENIKRCTLEIEWNQNMVSLYGLESVDTLSLELAYNEKLIDISALEGAYFIPNYFLHIRYNALLSECAILGICNRLAYTYGNVVIIDNAPGCNSIQEVDSICNLQGIEEEITLGNLLIFPNPAGNNIEMKGINCPAGQMEIEIYNSLGRLVIYEKQPFQDGRVMILVSNLTTGIYLLRAQVSEKLYTGRFVKE